MNVGWRLKTREGWDESHPNPLKQTLTINHLPQQRYGADFGHW